MSMASYSMKLFQIMIILSVSFTITYVFSYNLRGNFDQNSYDVTKILTEAAVE